MLNLGPGVGARLPCSRATQSLVRGETTRSLIHGMRMGHCRFGPNTNGWEGSSAWVDNEQAPCQQKE